MTVSSANGKVILVGEHAVVYGQPAIAIPVSEVGVEVTLLASTHGTRIDAPGIGLLAEIAQLESTNPIAKCIEVFSTETHNPVDNIDIKVISSIPVASGLGSGAAVSVALLKALNQHYATDLTVEHINAMAYEVEKIHHGTPSGIDNSVIAYGKPVYFIKGQPIETFSVRYPVHLVIGDTGVGALTKVAVADVRQLVNSQPGKYQPIIASIGEVVIAARAALELGDLPTLGDLMLRDQAHLEQLSVSSTELERLNMSAMDAGALGAKLSGGGRGGNMIALASSLSSGDKIGAALLAAGAKAVYRTTINPR